MRKPERSRRYAESRRRESVGGDERELARCGSVAPLAWAIAERLGCEKRVSREARDADLSGIDGPKPFQPPAPGRAAAGEAAQASAAVSSRSLSASHSSSPSRTPISPR